MSTLCVAAFLWAGVPAIEERVEQSYISVWPLYDVTYPYYIPGAMAIDQEIAKIRYYDRGAAYRHIYKSQRAYTIRCDLRNLPPPRRPFFN